MLHTSAIEPGTFSLLREMMELPILQPFHWLGEPLWLYVTVIEVPWIWICFIMKSLVNPKLLKILKEFQKRFVYKQEQTRFGIFCFIDGVKVDIVHFPHPPIAPFEEYEKVRFYSDADIAAMKIQAILGRGKKKDFWDLYELLQHYSLQQIIDWHKQKYPSQMLAISIPHAITYFVDADESETPLSFKNQTWAGD
jgi:hypothetical protein